MKAPAAKGRPTDQVVVQAVLDELDRRTLTRPDSGGVAAGVRNGSAPAPSTPPSPAARQRARAEGPQATTTAASLRAIRVGCSALHGVDPQVLGLTYSFEAAEDGEPYPMTIRFDGRRTGVPGKLGPQDRFSVVETIQQVVPGSGRVAITKRVENIAAGKWAVTAAPVHQNKDAAVPSMPSRASTTGATGFAPVIRVRAPGVRLGAWSGLVGAGTAAALTVQALLAARLSLPVTSVLLLSLVACLVGLVGAKLYYLAQHPPQHLGWMNMISGMCIQGFVLAAVGTLLVGAPIADLAIGQLLDVTAPGLLFGIAIGRVGCFLGGCCAGRPTGSRWGLWSSDRRLGVRRIPTQLSESTLALLVGLAALLAVWTTAPRPAGIVFVAAIAAYTLGRQLLFPLRDLPRRTAHGRVFTMAVAGLVLVAALAAVALG